MPADPTGAIGPILTALRALPIWLLAGLAVAGCGVLFLPPFGAITGAALNAFRGEWGAWVWVGTVTSMTLAIGRTIDSGIRGYQIHRNRLKTRKALMLAPRPGAWWYLAKQQDDSYASQISIDVDATNLTDRPVRILNVKLISPRQSDEVFQATATLPLEGSPYHSTMHPVPPHGTVEASVHIMVRGRLARYGEPIMVTIAIRDQFGEEYRLKGIRARSNNPPLPPIPWRKCLARNVQRVRKLVSAREQPASQPAVWQHGGRFADVDIILAEERRNYAANGRTRGGLGSLNVTLQSEPNNGWTKQGDIPRLLWNKEEHPAAVDSPNLTRLIRVYAALDDGGKRDLEEYLLSHLNKASTYTDVAYFIFVALHRMGRTIDSITAAQMHLSGDRVYGYSNLLGTLSAIVSREHFDIDPVLYPVISNLLVEDPEHNFRLIEKMNLARLHHLDGRQA